MEIVSQSAKEWLPGSTISSSGLAPSAGSPDGAVLSSPLSDPVPGPADFPSPWGQPSANGQMGPATRVARHKAPSQFATCSSEAATRVLTVASPLAKRNIRIVRPAPPGHRAENVGVIRPTVVGCEAVGIGIGIVVNYA